jgi:SAM-dependent methyltransferase
MTVSTRTGGEAMDLRVNYFSYPSAAERYAKGRPYLHPPVIDRIGAIVCPSGKVERALDVGCGTGHSTLALTEIADEVIGADASWAMLRHAPRPLAYVQAAAETLPFASGAFELITVGHAFHWFDRSPFLDEAARLLRPHGWLAIYGNHFLGQMVGNPDYERWDKEQYSPRFPAPPRNSRPLTEDDARPHGLALAAHQEFDHTVAYTADQLVAYLVTHSNVIAAAEAGSEDIGAIVEWLAASVKPLFRRDREDFQYRCVVDLFRRPEQGAIVRG